MRKKNPKEFSSLKFLSIKILVFLTIQSIAFPSAASAIGKESQKNKSCREIVVTGTVTSETGVIFAGVTFKIKGTDKAVKSIRECNYALQALSKINKSATHKKQLIAEMKFVQAFRYQDLIRKELRF